MALMRKFLSKKKTRVGLGLFVTTLALAASAIAYWTATEGTGTGVVKASAGGAGWEVSSTEVEGLFPGGTKSVTVKVKNKDAAQAEYLAKVETLVKSVENAAATEAEAEAGAKCWLGWFKVSENAVQEPKEVVPHETTVKKTAKVELEEKATKNQNGCKGKKLTLEYKAS